MNRIAGAVATVLLMGGAAQLQAQNAPVNITVTGRVHYQWSTTSLDAAEAGTSAPIPSNTFETRRVRLGVNVQIADWISGMLEPEYTLGRLQLRQVWMALALDSGTVVRAGQMKKPFGMMTLASSSRLAVIERGVRIRGLAEALAGADAIGALRGEALVGEHHALLEAQHYADYDMGLQLEQRVGPLALAAGVFNGSGPDTRDENDGKSLAARVSWGADVGTPLVVSAAWSQRELSLPSPTGPRARRGNAFAVDAELGTFRRGLWLIAEAATGDNLATEEPFIGTHAVLSYFVGTGGRKVEGVEPVARVSWGDPDTSVDGDAGLLLTPGVNLYFFGRNRFMLNWDVYLPQNEAVGTQHALRAQMNLHF